MQTNAAKDETDGAAEWVMGDRNEPLREEMQRYYGEIVNMGEYVIVGVRLCREGGAVLSPYPTYRTVYTLLYIPHCTYVHLCSFTPT